MEPRGRTITLDLKPDDLWARASVLLPDTPRLRRSVVAQRGASVRNQAYEALRHAIVQCRIRPNQALSEKEIAEALSISRTPVREALLRLADEGLVVIVPQQGTFATLISVVSVREAQLTREMLERAALATALRTAPSYAFDQLRSVIREQQRAAEAQNGEVFMALDQRFHVELAGLSGYENLGRVATNARAHLDRIRSLDVFEDKPLKDLTREHEQIIDAMSTGDLITADRVLTTHLRRVLDTLPRLRASHPDFFAEEAELGPLVLLTVGLESIESTEEGG